VSAPGRGDAAFPIPLDDRPGAYPAEPGMTLRDYFAAKAMQAFAADPELGWADGLTGMAKQAYRWADAMLRERAK
jgi:hypothetical protein